MIKLTKLIVILSISMGLFLIYLSFYIGLKVIPPYIHEWWFIPTAALNVGLGIVGFLLSFTASVVICVYLGDLFDEIMDYSMGINKDD